MMLDRAGSAEPVPTQLRLQLDGFEGPLELLLSLIEQNRLPITQVSLAQVADQYLAQVYALPELDPNLLADFLAIGGRLLLIKSRALLLSEERDPVVEETASELEQRLAEYRIFRAAADYIQELEQRGMRTYPTKREPQENTVVPPLAPIAPDALVAVWRRLQRKPAPTTVEIEAVRRASVDERRSRILDLLRSRPQISFAELAGATVDEVVASFLAVLELFRRGLVTVNQEHAFGELTIARMEEQRNGVG
jgi:segregation and condensation protein A